MNQRGTRADRPRSNFSGGEGAPEKGEGDNFIIEEFSHLESNLELALSGNETETLQKGEWEGRQFEQSISPCNSEGMTEGRDA